MSDEERARAAARARLNRRLGIAEDDNGDDAGDLAASSRGSHRSTYVQDSFTRGSSVSRSGSHAASYADSEARHSSKGSVSTTPIAPSLLMRIASAVRNILDAVPPLVRLCVAFVLMAFIFIAVVSNACSACTATRESSEPVAVESDDQQEQSEEEEQPEQADFSLLPQTLDADVISGLQSKASDERIVQIINHGEGLAALGQAAQEKLLKLAAKDDASISYVADFSSKYPAVAGEAYTDTVTKGTIPDLKQWDERWGYVNYCDGPMGLTGCCPTSLAMVYMGLTGNTDKTPADFAALATEDGFAVSGEGTVGDYLIYEASSLGLTCQWFYPSSQTLLWYLENGYAVIVNVGEGDFTTSGHFFVAYGVDGAGNVKINDPYSSVNTAKTWDADLIANQSIAMYAFAAL